MRICTHECPPDSIHLTALEQKIITMLAHGAQTKQIGEALDRSPHTIQNTITYVYEKLGVHTRAELVLMMFKQGIIT